MSDGFFRARNGLSLGNLASDPSTGVNGDTYYNTTSNTFREYVNGAWTDAVQTTLAQTLTNKVLSGNTASNLINGAGTLDLNSTGTITVPNGTDTLVGQALTQTLTNKTINGANNTISNVSLTADVTGTLPVANGGTGDTSFTANQVVLGGTTSTGPLAQVAGGTSTFVLTSNGPTAAPTWQIASGNFGSQGTISVFTSSTTFTTSSNSTTATIYQFEIVGGGGGGGSGGASGNDGAAGGGGSGTYVRGSFTGRGPGTGISIVIGVGGAGGSGGGAGNGGTATTISGIANAPGGNPSQGYNSAILTQYGTGAGGGTGGFQTSSPGANGSIGIADIVCGGQGASTPFGGGGAGGIHGIDGNGLPGGGYGAGGGGACDQNGAGGSGANGICIITQMTP